MIWPGHREDRFAAHLIFIIDERLVLVGEEKLAHPVLKNYGAESMRSCHTQGSIPTFDNQRQLGRA